MIMTDGIITQPASALKHFPFLEIANREEKRKPLCLGLALEPGFFFPPPKHHRDISGTLFQQAVAMRIAGPRSAFHSDVELLPARRGETWWYTLLNICSLDTSPHQQCGFQRHESDLSLPMHTHTHTHTLRHRSLTCTGIPDYGPLILHHVLLHSPTELRKPVAAYDIGIATTWTWRIILKHDIIIITDVESHSCGLYVP